jgi:two-component system invasion response regulator UvrY
VKIVGECSSGEEAVELVRAITPDILLTEVVMPGIGGLEALHRIKLMQAGTRVVVLIGQSHAPFPTQMLRAGASGFLSKNVTVEELDLCLRRVYFGRSYICEDVAQELAHYASGAAK